MIIRPARRMALTILALVSTIFAFALAAPDHVAPAGANGCVNNCPLGASGLSYLGGILITSPHVYLVRFSDSPTTLSPGGFSPGHLVPHGLPGALSAVLDQAKNNEYDNFRLVFDRKFLSTVVERMDGNEAIYKRVLDDEEFQKALMDLYALRLHQRLHQAS